MKSFLPLAVGTALIGLPMISDAAQPDPETKADIAQAKADARQARGEANAERMARYRAWQAAHPVPPASATAAWDPRGDDPSANVDDGNIDLSREAAIFDRGARAEAKAEAWAARAERLLARGHVLAASRAIDHHVHWVNETK